MKKIFVIGDSISLYYHAYLKELLKEEAIYYRKGDEKEIQVALHDPNNPFGANGGDSKLIIEYLEQMKQKNQSYDLLLINCGLHDIRTDRESLKKQIDEKEYEENLKKIISLGKKLSNKLIWISTTHVNDKIHNARKGGYLRYNEDVVRYNEIADKIMKQNYIEIIDLYQFTKKIESEEMYRDHVHFKDEISKKQAEFIFESIKKYL